MEIEILGIAEDSHPADKKMFDAFVKPFIALELTKIERRALAESNLRVEKYTRENLSQVADFKRRDADRYLVGQDKVVASRHLPKGICIGVLQGKIYDYTDRKLPESCA